MTTTITIISERQGRFTTALFNEKPLVTVPTTNPEYASCRALVARGEPDGPAQFRHAGSAIIASRIRSIHDGARLQVIENDRKGLRTVAYRPFVGLGVTTLPAASLSAEIGDTVHRAGHV